MILIVLVNVNTIVITFVEDVIENFMKLKKKRVLLMILNYQRHLEQIQAITIVTQIVVIESSPGYRLR